MAFLQYLQGTPKLWKHWFLYFIISDVTIPGHSSFLASRPRSIRSRRRPWSAWTTSPPVTSVIVIRHLPMRITRPGTWPWSPTSLGPERYLTINQFVFLFFFVGLLVFVVLLRNLNATELKWSKTYHKIV